MHKPLAALEIKANSVTFALCVQLVTPCGLSVGLMSDAYCLFGTPASKQEWHGDWDVSIATCNEIHRARIRKSFILEGTPATQPTVCV